MTATIGNATCRTRQAIIAAVRFDDRLLDEIKSRLRLSDVIGRTVKLKRQGREFVGLSPFTKERTPSFFVNDDKGFFHDFSSGKSGDLITFLQETERLSFVESVERLAGEAGVTLPAPDSDNVAQDEKRAGLAPWLEVAAAWFEATLRRPAGANGRRYLSGRGLAETEWARFRLGYAPGDSSALKDHLIAKGAHPAALVEAGLLIAPEDGRSPYDRFRARIIFPIADGRGRVVSFGGRAMDAEARAKYLNGPDSPLFDKGRLLYGLFEARRLLGAAGEGAALVVVEGYMDVIACQRAGVAAVASMGTALTEAQMEALWRLHPAPTLCFDGDRAGMAAAARVIERALPHLTSSRSFNFALVTGGKDPDDILRDQGPAALRSQLAATTPLVEALFVKEKGSEPLDTPERRASLKQRLRAAARSIADPDLSQAYRDALMSRFEALMASPAPRPRALGPRGRRGSARYVEPPAPSTAEGRAAAKRLNRTIKPVAAALAKRVLDDPPVIDPHLETLEARGLGDPALAPLSREVVRLRLDCDRLDSDTLRRHLATSGFSALLTDIAQAAEHSRAPFLKEDVTLAAARSQWSHAFGVLDRLAALEEALELAKLSLGPDAGASAFLSLKTERDELRRAIEAETIWTPEEFGRAAAPL